MKKFRYLLALIALVALSAPAFAQQTLEQATDSIKNVLLQAKKGDAVAQNEVGMWYYIGRHVPQNYDEALQWWAKSAKQGNALAIGNLGMCYQTGHGVAADPDKAMQLYLRSIEMGNPALVKQQSDLAAKGDVFSNLLLATCYLEGKGMPKDANKAVPYLTVAANKGSADAQRQLGLLYLNARKPSEAVKWFKMGADAGDAECCYQYGRMLLEGLGTAPDSGEGANLLLKAANAGYPEAMYAVGNCYMEGNGVTRNAEQAVKWFRKAAAANVTGAQWALAQCYREGNGVSVSFDRAVYWYAASLQGDYAEKFRTLVRDQIPGSPFVAYLKGLKAYNDNNFEEALKQFKIVEKAKVTDGMVMEALVLASDKNPKQNLKKAVKLLTEASATNARAAYRLATLYEEGRGVDKDMAKAVDLTRRAAEMGYGPAQCALADMYFEGRGVDRNYGFAVKWYAEAYSQGELSEAATKRFARCFREGLGGLSASDDMAKEVEDSYRKNRVADLLKLV